MSKKFYLTALILLFLAAGFSPQVADACAGCVPLSGDGSAACGTIAGPGPGGVNCRILAKLPNLARSCPGCPACTPTPLHGISPNSRVPFAGAPTLNPTNPAIPAATVTAAGSIPRSFPPYQAGELIPRITLPFCPTFSGCPGCNPSLDWNGWPVWPGQTIHLSEDNINAILPNGSVTNNSIVWHRVQGNSAHTPLRWRVLQFPILNDILRISNTPTGNYPLISHTFASSNNTVIVDPGISVMNDDAYGGRILNVIGSTRHSDPGPGDFTNLPVGGVFVADRPLLASYNTFRNYGMVQQAIRGGSVVLHNQTVSGSYKARGNTVIVRGCAINEASSGSVQGGRVIGNNDAFTSYVTYNIVEIEGRSQVGHVFGGIAGGATATAAGNRVYVREDVGTGITVQGNIFGGSAETQNFPGNRSAVVAPGSAFTPATSPALPAMTPIATATAKSNTVNIIGDHDIMVIGVVHGGTARTVTRSEIAIADLPGYDAVHEVANNNVTIGGVSVVVGDIHGGSSLLNFPGGAAAGNPTGRASASVINNTVDISGNAEVGGRIFGGFVHYRGNLTNNPLPSGSFFEAIDNTVTISGTPDLSNSVLFGGFIGANHAASVSLVHAIPGMDAVSGNTLNVNSALITVNGVENFYYVNFILPTAVMSAPYNRVMLTSNNPANVFSIGDGGNTVGITFDPTIPASLPRAEDYGFDVADPDTLPTDIILILNVTDAPSQFISRHVTVGQYKFCVFVANNVPGLGAHDYNLVARLIEVIELGSGNDYDPCDCDDDYGAAGGPRRCIHGGSSGCNTAGAGLVMLALALAVKKFKM